MWSLSTFPILLLGLAVLFWAPVAKADCPHNDDDTHQHCGGEPTPSTDEMILNHLEPKLVFVTNGQFTGDLGGLVGADAKCQAAADDASLGGTFQAWLSDGDPDPDYPGSVSTPTNRWDTLAQNLYFMIGGRPIAANYTDLLLRLKLLESPQITETGAPVFDFVWTGTSGHGTLIGEGCDDWTSEDGAVTGWAGDPQRVDGGWTTGGGAFSCNTPLHLYCFEQ